MVTTLCDGGNKHQPIYLSLEGCSRLFFEVVGRGFTADLNRFAPYRMLSNYFPGAPHS